MWSYTSPSGAVMQAWDWGVLRFQSVASVLHVKYFDDLGTDSWHGRRAEMARSLRRCPYRMIQTLQSAYDTIYTSSIFENAE
jgi:hypothetical protein